MAESAVVLSESIVIFHCSFIVNGIYMASNIHKSASAPVSGTATPSGKADSVFDPIEIETEPHFVGHLGHLTESQTEALKDFKDQLSKASLYTPASEDGSTNASHDDATLLWVLSTLRYPTLGTPIML